MKLGSLGLILGLMAAFGLFLSGSTHVSAQAAENCVAATTTGNGGAVNCTFSTSVALP